MSNWLSEREMSEVAPAELDASGSPIPTRVVSNGEFNPIPQTPEQRQVAARIDDLAARFGSRTGLDRREFLKTASGMAAAFIAMNEIHGWFFDVDHAEASDPERAQERASRLASQLIFDDHRL